MKTIRSNEQLIESLEGYYTRKDSIFIDTHIKYKMFKIELIEDGLVVYMSQEILTPQKVCDSQLLHSILFTLKSNFDVSYITILVDGIEMNTYKINQLHFNKL